MLPETALGEYVDITRYFPCELVLKVEKIYNQVKKNKTYVDKQIIVNKFH